MLNKATLTNLICLCILILSIQTYGETNTFLINYAGPPSGKMVRGENTTWKTFPRYPLSQTESTK